MARPRAFLQVEIEAPSPGVYQVVVSAYNVPDGPQDFALVVTGDFVELVSCDSVDVKTQSPSDLLRTQSPDSSRSPTERTEPPYAFATFNPHARAHVAVAALPSPPLTPGRGLERAILQHVSYSVSLPLVGDVPSKLDVRLCPCNASRHASPRSM